MNKNITYYRVPDKNWYRIHFVRPRFKGNIENVLLYMANECCKIPTMSCKEYSQKYFKAIRMFPGNIDMSDKTLNNWRTEIPALFGFYKENKDSGMTETTQMAYFLNEHQDLTAFLRLFLLTFQFPGGHLKTNDVKDVIKHKIKFKPVKTIIQVLVSGNEILSAENSEKQMSMSAEEATYCIFNDTMVTSGKRSPKEVAEIILRNRKEHKKYYNPDDKQSLSLTGTPRTKGDMTRYAADILDYMNIACIVDKHYGYYTLKGNQRDVVRTYLNDNLWFKGYDSLYNKKDLKNSDITHIEYLWFDYVNQSMNPEIFKTNLSEIFEGPSELDVVFGERIKDIINDKSTTNKQIGNLGESLVCGHERMRLKLNNYKDFIRLVQIVDSPSYHPGYDIDSFEGDGTQDHRYIEVKTTISKNKIQLYEFHMSANEWSVAGTIKDHYCVYRLMLSEQEKTLYILRDPVRLYKTDKIEAAPRNGMDVSFSTETFKPSELLTWKD